MKRFSKIVVAIAALVFSFTRYAISEEALSGSTDTELCSTSTGIPGAVFSGLYNTVAAPGGSEAVSLSSADGIVRSGGAVSNGDIMIFPELSIDQAMLVEATAGTGNQNQTTIVFKRATGDVLGRCQIKTVVFDPAIHDLSLTSVGECPFSQADKISRLSVGATKTVELPVSADEMGFLPSTALDVAREGGAQQISITGLAEGAAVFVWATLSLGEDKLMGVCPFVVSEN